MTAPEAASTPSLLNAKATVHAAKPMIAARTQTTIAPAEGAGCFCPSRKFSHPVTIDATTKAALMNASQ